MEEEVIERAVNCLRSGKNIMLWKESVGGLNLGNRAVHVRDFNTCKPRLMEVYEKFAANQKQKLESHQLSRLTVLQLIGELKRLAEKRKLVIAFDSFEYINPSTAETLLDLQEHPNICLVASRSGEFKQRNGAVRRLYQTFTIINIEKLQEEGQERDLTLVVLSCAFFYFLAIFIKAIVSQEQHSTILYGGIVGMFWLIFLMSRTFLYVTLSRGRAR